MEDEELFNLKSLEEQLRKSTTGRLPQIPESLLQLSPNSCSPTLPTLFDISEADRNRVLKLIQELIDSQDQVDALRQELDEERSKFKEKRSKLIKKIDCFHEKYEKAISENKCLKHIYCDKFKLLEEKISIVSDKLEISHMEVRQLREANEKLTAENLSLRKLQSDSATVIASYQKEKTKLKEKTEIYKQKERDCQRQLKRFTSGEHQSESESLTRGEGLQTVQNSRSRMDSYYKLSGAGDYRREPCLSSSQDSLSTSTPVNLLYSKNPRPEFVPEIPKPIPKVSEIDSRQIGNYNFPFRNDDEEKAILESLFFRF